MSLLPDDPIPTGISPQKAYKAIRDYLQANRQSFLPENNPPRNFMGNIIPGATHSEQEIQSFNEIVGLIDFLPAPDQLRDVDFKAVFKAVTTGRLETAYHRSDGKYKMAAYALEAMKTMTGDHYSSLTVEESNAILAGVFGNRLFYRNP